MAAKSVMSGSTTTMVKKPKGDARWHGMMKRRTAFKRMHKKKKTNVYGVGIENSHGVSWVRRRLLGQGGFGSVFLATTNDNVDFPPKIAVKSANINNASTLKLEKQILCDLKANPYVVTCYGDEETESSDGEKFYNVLLEYCFCSLQDRIEEWGCGLPESEVRCYTRDVVLGLKDIHCRYYVHCDLKLDNILLVRDGCTGGYNAKIADFGIAEIMTFEEEEECSSLKGTHRYMSPELVRNKKIGYPTDIWALGCIVVEMLSGEAVWDFEGGYRNDSDINDLLHRIGYTSDIPEIPSDISEEAKDFLGKCLVRSTEHRWTACMLIEHPFLAVDKC